MSLVVALDFDGTVVKHKPKYTNDLDYELYENCEAVLNRLHDKGVKFVLHTARTGIRRVLAVLYIKVHKLPVSCPMLNRKPVADIYIDNKNLECNGIDWLKIEKQILERENNGILV